MDKKKNKTKRTSRQAPRPRSRQTASTALVRHQPAALAPLPPNLPVLAKDSVDVGRSLTDAILLGELGLQELKLTDAEEMILARPIPKDEIMVKPTAAGQIYLSHPYYTRLLNEAFGRGGWALVPASKPAKSGNSVVCPYVLFVHRVPVAYGVGEQEYFEGNKDQTYGDALESTIASGLRRCAKRLGIGLELWDRRYTRDFLETHAICVKTTSRDGKEFKQWRRKDDPPFYNEVGPARRSSASRSEPARSEPTRSEPQERQTVHHPQAAEPINEKQLKRLWTIIRNSGRSDQEVKAWLESKYRMTSTRQITRAIYEDVCSAIERPGFLSAERVPGEEG